MRKRPPFSDGDSVIPEVHVVPDGHEIRLDSAAMSPGSYRPQHMVEYSHGLVHDPESGEDDGENRAYMEAEANAFLMAGAFEMYEVLYEIEKRNREGGEVDEPFLMRRVSDALDDVARRPDIEAYDGRRL